MHKIAKYSHAQNSKIQSQARFSGNYFHPGENKFFRRGETRFLLEGGNAISGRVST
jgi:hypothetical protein